MLTIDSALILFSDVLISIGEYLSDPDSCLNLRNTVAIATGQISLNLSSECEQFGMNKGIYSALMKYSKSNKIQFLSLISRGFFYFEGRNDYGTKLLVYTKSNGADRIGSQIPAEWLPLPVVIEEAAPKRRLERDERGPGKKDYSSNKNANQVTKLISENTFKIIDELLVGYNNTKINQIIKGLILRMRKCYNVYESKNKKEINKDKIVESLKNYLTGLQEHGSRSAQVETMISAVLSSVSFKESKNTEIAELLNVHRKKIARCKKKENVSFLSLIRRLIPPKRTIQCNLLTNQLLMNIWQISDQAMKVQM